MTQQPYYPPQGQQYPPQQVPQQYPPQQQFPPQFPQQPQPGYGQPQGYGQPPAQQAPQQPLVQGTLSDFLNQRSAGSGPGLSWSNKDGSKKEIGFWYAGVVARDVSNGDIQQQTNPQGVPQFYNDGQPKFQMLVPLKQIQAANGDTSEFTEGEGTWYCRGQAKDELTRAMAEAGCTYTVPKAGDFVVITLVQRRQGRPGFQPANVFQIRYTPAQGNAGAQQVAPAQDQQQATGAPSPAPEAPAQVQQPMQQAPAPQQYAQAPAPQPFQQPAGQPQGQPVQPSPQAPAPQQYQAPAAPQGAPQPPSGLDPNAQAILQQLAGAGQAPQG